MEFMKEKSPAWMAFLYLMSAISRTWKAQDWSILPTIMIISKSFTEKKIFLNFIWEVLITDLAPKIWC